MKRIELIEEENVIRVRKEDIVRPEIALQLEIRNSGEFNGLAYYLPVYGDWKGAEWTVGRDSQGVQILICVKD